MPGGLPQYADDGDRRDGVARCAYVLAAILLGQAIWFGVPGFSAAALGLVIAAIGATAAGLMWRRVSSQTDAAAARASTWLIMLGVIAGFARLPFREINPGYPAGDATFFLLAGIAAFLAAGVFFARRRAQVAACFWVLVVVYLAMGAWYLLLGNRQAMTDVHLVQHLGCEALLGGRNPFAMTFPDLYGPASPIYPRGIVVDGRVQCGFFYPPLPLLMALPGYLAGDVRYAHLAAIALSAVLVAYATPRKRPTARVSGRAGHGHDANWPGFAPAVMLLFMPTAFYQARGAWIEPFLLLLACATVFLAARAKLSVAAATLGLLVVAKQYAPFALAATPMLGLAWSRRRLLALVAIAAAAGAAVTLPLALWDPRAFLHSQTALYLGMLRHDSISLAPLIARATGWRPMLWWPALAAALAAAAVILMAPKSSRGPATFAAAAAIVLLCAFAFSTQAFGNYYFLAGGMLLCASAATNAAPAREAGEH